MGQGSRDTEGAVQVVEQERQAQQSEEKTRSRLMPSPAAR